MKIISDHSAFPIHDDYRTEFAGLTKREYVAIEMMKAMIASNDIRQTIEYAGSPTWKIPQAALNAANQLLKLLNEPQPPK